MHIVVGIHFTQFPVKMLFRKLEMEGEEVVRTFPQEASGTLVVRIRESGHACLPLSRRWSPFAFKIFR